MRVKPLLVIALALTLSVSLQTSALASDSVFVYGPMALALESTYRQWTALHGFVPPASFEAIVDGRRDPYTVRFMSTGDAIATDATYEVPADTVLDPRLPALPAFFLPRHLGPLRLRGSYVMAFDAAYRFREEHRPYHSFALLNGDTSFAGLSTMTWYRNNYWVALHYYAPNPDVIGCDDQQNYDVDWRTFQVTPTKGCLPM
jgi:hypothetical protein